MKKRIIALALVLVMACGLLPLGAAAADEATFTDVMSDSWFVDDVKYVYQEDLMYGENGRFSPDVNLDRGTMAEVLHRMEGMPDSPRAEFSDVPAGSRYAKAVDWGVSVGLINGRGDGSFGPYDPVTREQMATFLYRYAEYKGIDVSAKADLSAFGDAGSISDYARLPVAWANAAKLVNGVGGGLIAPRGTATRAQIAALVHRFCVTVVKRVPAANPPEFVPSENPGAIFKDMAGKEFCFMSGAGVWTVTFTVNADGSMSGSYYSFTTVTGSGFPNGTARVCEFSGRMENVKKISDSEYSVELSALEYKEPVGKTWIKDGMKYIVSDPNGLSKAKELRIYLPDSATSGLPKYFISSVSGPNHWGKTPAKLPFWGIYNVNEKIGFFSR